MVAFTGVSFYDPWGETVCFKCYIEVKCETFKLYTVGYDVKTHVLAPRHLTVMT